MTETLRDTELEVDTLKSELKKKDLAIKEAEERCGHLVRCGEQKNQEHRTFSEVAKNMLINQGIQLHCQLGFFFCNFSILFEFSILSDFSIFPNFQFCPIFLFCLIFQFCPNFQLF